MWLKIFIPMKTKNQYPAYAAKYSDDGKKNQMIQTL